MPTARPVRVDVPATVHDLALLARVDYEDAFAVETDRQRTPQQWLRTLLQDAPQWFRVPWVGLGTVVLGARFGPLRAEDHVLGWRLLADRDTEAVIGLEASAGLSARLVALTQPGHTVIATQLQVDTAYTRALLPVILPVHRYAVPYLLGRANRIPAAALR